VVIPFVKSTGTSSISAQYPEAYIPAAGNFNRLAYLDDAVAGDGAGAINYAYPTITAPGGVRSGAKSVAAQSCLPYVKSYSSPITSISAA